MQLQTKMKTLESDKTHIQQVDALEKRIDTYEKIVALHQWKAVHGELLVHTSRLENVRAELSKSRDTYTRQQLYNTSVQHIARAAADIKTRLSNMIEFHRRFVGDKKVDGFKMWVYKSMVIPMIEKEVNGFIQNIDDFTLKIRIRNGHFIYMLHDRGSTPTLDHASGYQKFIVGLGMRIALSRIGAVGQNMKHLFIDEGFVACDSNNILKIKEVIDLLKTVGGYNSVMLISHLEAIKDIAQTRIDVCRPDDAKTSSIRLGVRRKAIQKARVEKAQSANNANSTTAERKKPGRPSKAAIAAALKSTTNTQLVLEKV